MTAYQTKTDRDDVASANLTLHLANAAILLAAVVSVYLPSSLPLLEGIVLVVYLAGWAAVVISP